MHKITLKDFLHINFGDIRRDERFVSIINNISSQPGASIPKQNKKWYDTKATYEFFKNEDVSLEELKKTIMMYGAKKLTNEMIVLIAHDISNISYNDLRAEGLGYLDNKEGRGILCYSSIACTTEGLPLSLLYQHTWTRPLEEFKEKNSGIKNEEDIIHWKLLTTLEITSVSDALKCAQWYAFRWLIERFHYVLKSGTKIEELRLKMRRVYKRQLMYTARQHSG